MYDMPDCPLPPPPPPLFAIVGYHQNVNTGSPWPLDGSSYWHPAIVLFALILLVTVWSYVRLARSAPPGWRRRLSALLVGVGALGMLVLVGYLLLVGWPGTQLDTRWWFSEFSSYGGSCPNALNQVDHEHTLMRDADARRAEQSGDLEPARRCGAVHRGSCHLRFSWSISPTELNAPNGKKYPTGVAHQHERVECAGS